MSIIRVERGEQTVSIQKSLGWAHSFCAAHLLPPRLRVRVARGLARFGVP